MLAVWLTEDRPQELGGAGPRTLGFKEGSNQLPGQPEMTQTHLQPTRISITQIVIETETNDRNIYEV